jgi:predicted amidohydrolase
MAPLHCTLLQADLIWENKQANLQKLESMIAGIVGAKELVILPEMFNTGFSLRPELLGETMEGPSVSWMKQMAQQYRIILAGSLMITESGKHYNRLIWMQPDGRYAQYDKRHLFAYAGENEHFTAGDHRLITQANGFKILWQVCYDLRFPVWARQQSSETLEYDVLVYVANWPERRSHAWKSLLIARAIENQCYVIGVNRVGEDGNGIAHSGDSMVVDPLGQVLLQLSNREGVETAVISKQELEQARSLFPFWKDADSFTILQSNDLDE